MKLSRPGCLLCTKLSSGRSSGALCHLVVWIPLPSVSRPWRRDQTSDAKEKVSRFRLNLAFDIFHSRSFDLNTVFLVVTSWDVCSTKLYAGVAAVGNF